MNKTASHFFLFDSASMGRVYLALNPTGCQAAWHSRNYTESIAVVLNCQPQAAWSLTQPCLQRSSPYVAIPIAAAHSCSAV
jgi:hypothetical protein